MSRPYSLDLRERVVAGVNDGLTCLEAAGHFGVSLSSAQRWMRLAAATGSPASLPMGGKRPFSLEAERAWTLQRFAEAPDLTLRALLAELAQRGIVVSYYALWHIVHRHGLSFRKKPARQRAAAA